MLHLMMPKLGNNWIHGYFDLNCFYFESKMFLFSVLQPVIFVAHASQGSSYGIKQLFHKMFVGDPWWSYCDSIDNLKLEVNWKYNYFL